MTFEIFIKCKRFSDGSHFQSMTEPTVCPVSFTKVYGQSNRQRVLRPTARATPEQASLRSAFFCAVFPIGLIGLIGLIMPIGLIALGFLRENLMLAERSEAEKRTEKNAERSEAKKKQRE